MKRFRSASVVLSRERKEEALGPAKPSKYILKYMLNQHHESSSSQIADFVCMCYIYLNFFWYGFFSISIEHKKSRQLSIR